MPLAVTVNTKTLRFPPNPPVPHRAIFRITNDTYTPIVFKVTSSAGNIYTVSPPVGEIPHRQGRDVTVSLTPPCPAAQYRNHPAHTVTVIAAAVPLQKTPAYKPGSRFAIEREPNASKWILPIKFFPAVNDTSTKSPQASTPPNLQPNIQHLPPGRPQPPVKAPLSPQQPTRQVKPLRPVPRPSPRPRSPPNPPPRLAARPPPPPPLTTLPGTAGTLERRAHTLTPGRKARPPKAVPSMRPMPSKTAKTPPPARERARALASTSSASGRLQARGAPLTPPPPSQVQYPDAGGSKEGISVQSRSMSTGTHPIKISDRGPKNQIPKREQRSGIKDDIPEIGSTAPIPLQILATEVARGNREVARQPVPRHILPWERADWVENIRSWMIERLEEECNAKCSASSIVPEMLVGGVRMRAKTSKGDFMAVAYPGSGGGAAKIGVLGRVVPRYIFRVVCMSENKEAVLMRDHPGLFNYKVSVKEMEAATKDYVWMQMGTIGRTSELVEGGLMDLRSEVLLRKLDNLEQSLMFREMASRQAFKKSVRWYLGTKRRIRNGVTELMGCGIPETVLGGQGCRKGEGGEHYLFHRWFEGFVGCALAAVDEWILREGVFLKMWSCFGETEKMVRWRAIGKCVHWLSLLVMRLEYAQHSEAESAEREWWVTQAGSALVKMKDRFIETSHRW